MTARYIKGTLWAVGETGRHNEWSAGIVEEDANMMHVLRCTKEVADTMRSLYPDPCGCKPEVMVMATIEGTSSGQTTGTIVSLLALGAPRAGHCERCEPNTGPPSTPDR